MSSYKELPAELFDECFDDNLEGSWWYRTLEDSGLTDQFQFHYAVIRLDGKPAGIAPAFAMELPMDLVVPEAVLPIFKFFGTFFKSALYQRTLFIGSPCADEGTIGLMPGVELPQIAPTLQQAVEALARKTNAQMIVWKDFPEAAVVSLDGFIRKNGMFLTPSYPCATVKLNEIDSLDEYLKRKLRSQDRKNLKKKLRRSRSFAELETTVVQAPSDKVLEDIFALFWQTYEKSDTKFEKLNIEFFKLISKVPNSWFVLLRDKQSDKLIGFMLCFKLKDKIISKFLGLDYEQDSRLFLYYRACESALSWAIACGAGEFQSGQTGYKAKVEIGNTLIPLTNICKHRNPLIHYVYRKGARTITWSTLDKGLEFVLKSHPEYDRSRPWENHDDQGKT